MFVEEFFESYVRAIRSPNPSDYGWREPPSPARPAVRDLGPTRSRPHAISANMPLDFIPMLHPGDTTLIQLTFNADAVIDTVRIRVGGDDSRRCYRPSECGRNPSASWPMRSVQHLVGHGVRDNVDPHRVGPVFRKLFVVFFVLAFALPTVRQIIVVA